MPRHVLIIGAGTGGLALAHALRKSASDITFAVYERDRTRTDGLFGYRVGISPEGSRCLAACLPPDLFDVFKSTTAIPPDSFNMITEQYHELLSIDGFSKESEDGVAGERSVSRMTLRQVLLTGLEDSVYFDKHFTHYTSNGDGTVTAFFKDGTSASGDLLVGADGSGSPVRQQFLPQAKLKESGLYGITAKVELNAETKAFLPPKALRGVTMVNAPRGDSCIIHVMEFPWDHDGKPKGSIGSSDEQLLRNWPGLTFDNTRDYILLGFGSHGSRLPEDFMSMDGPSLHKLLLDRIATWHPDFRKLFDMSEASTSFPINIRTSERMEPWESTNVALLGDAIHTMTPGLGVGANTALLDAKILAESLVSKSDISSAVAMYESEMHSYAWKRVEKSLERFNANDAVYKPGLVGALATMVQRGGMRLVNSIPPLKSRVASEMTKERGNTD
ncbi:FAD-dependent monooxygenase [Purpureocillium lavendulum]|uniref:FAD-dependent monooxygenase n=1 Tax=Purpureocillium lavendulum TaxID=1247861 RepID=A0AB34FUX7_9HYPO|nr:FAD-dependent monooxygenase [Purpureocillium lavendulum]